MLYTIWPEYRLNKHVGEICIFLDGKTTIFLIHIYEVRYYIVLMYRVQYNIVYLYYKTKRKNKKNVIEHNTILPISFSSLSTLNVVICIT